MTDEIVNELLAELAAPYLAAQRQPGDVDKDMLAQASGLKPCQAAKRLEMLAETGQLVKAKIFENGRWKNVYRRPGK